MTPEQQKVLQFHQKANLPFEFVPTYPDRNELNKMILLGNMELSLIDSSCVRENMEDIAHHISKLLYVTYGIATICGLDIQEIFDEVHKSGMSTLNKMDREGNPIPNGVSFTMPDLKPIIDHLTKRMSPLSRNMEICSTCHGERTIRIRESKDEKTCPACKGTGQLPTSHHI